MPFEKIKLRSPFVLSLGGKNVLCIRPEVICAQMWTHQVHTCMHVLREPYVHCSEPGPLSNKSYISLHIVRWAGTGSFHDFLSHCVYVL